MMRLDVRDLSVEFATSHGPQLAVRNVSFAMGPEKLGVVGESGSGKSTLCRALLGIALPGRVRAERLTFNDEDLTSLRPRELQKLRGRRIGMVLQDPRHALNPVMTVGRQVAEVFTVHGRMTRRQARNRALDAFRAVRINDPEAVFDLYPHQVSGGMGQRIMIAAALAPEPDLLIADEPTSALDVTVAEQVMTLICDLVENRGMGLILVSHNLDLVTRFCDRVLIMYAGRVVEVLERGKLAEACHPYTKGLLACRPTLERSVDMLPTLVRDPGWLA